MTDRNQSFISRWTHPDYRPQPCTSDSLDRAESQLGVLLPMSLRDFLESFGPISTTIELLGTIVDGEMDLHDVSEFHDPDAIVQETLAWRRLGLPQTLVAFARDCSGNLFCFAAATERHADSEVWYFDHDFRDHVPLGVGFKGWIGAFAELPAR